MKVLLLVVAAVGLFLCAVLAAPLDDYVYQNDPTYAWKENSTFKTDAYTAHVLRMTSQTWLTSADTNHPVWQHWLLVCVPNKVLYDTAFLYIDGGSNNDAAPTKVNFVIEPFCLKTNTISAHLMQVPNEPIAFADGKGRSEDSIIAYTWEHFLNNTKTTSPVWLLQMAMTKAAVRALDTIQSFSATLSGSGVPKVNSFIVSGASKRGWVTWLTGAVDKRVKAIVPIVMPILNMSADMNHHYQAYGYWSFALDDYTGQGVMHHLNHPEIDELIALVDPFSFRDRLTVPKYIITASGDEFFLPDSPRFFYDELLGEKYLRVVPNAEHSLAPHDLDVVNSIIPFCLRVVNSQPRPTMSYNLTSLPNGNIKLSISTKEKPSAVRLWHANTPSTTRRDFRLLICDNLKNPSCLQAVPWLSTVLTDSTNTGVYDAELSPPTRGWKGYFAELEYAFSEQAGFTFKITTQVSVLPDTLPFPSCGQQC